MIRSMLFVALGGSLGSVARFLLSKLLQERHHRFLWARWW